MNPPGFQRLPDAHPCVFRKSAAQPVIADRARPNAKQRLNRRRAAKFINDFINAHGVIISISQNVT
ncbi:MAG: hypothetical protein EBV87_06950 [Alphaproteobacteria bacterium]|nr:hypothetical protein [Alphaproteobacteria bacterium]